MIEVWAIEENHRYHDGVEEWVLMTIVADERTADILVEVFHTLNVVLVRKRPFKAKTFEEIMEGGNPNV